MPKEKDRSEYHVRSVQRALRILECFTEHDPYLGVSEISEMLGIHKSTVHALLITLEDEGFVSKNEENGKYFLSYKLYRLGNVVLNNISIDSVAKPFMRMLRDATGQSAALNIKVDDKRLVLSVCEVDDPVKIYLKPGESLSLHSNAAGKVLLADMSDSEIEELIDRVGLEAMTPNTITEKDHLLEEINAVRKNGYAVCSGESYWAGSVSTPIYDAYGKVVASLCIYGPIQEYNEENMENYIGMCKHYAEKISAVMGYKN